MSTFEDMLSSVESEMPEPVTAAVMGTMVVGLSDKSLVSLIRLALIEASYRVQANQPLRDGTPTDQELNECLRRTIGLLLESVDD